MTRNQGLTVIEVLIALAVIAAAFAVLAYAQVTNLKASSRMRVASEAKSVAESVLESKVAEVLNVYTSGNSIYNDASSGYKSYAFIDYYWTCASDGTVDAQSPSSWTGSRTGLRTVTCTGADTRPAQDGNVTADWKIGGESGPLGEGVIHVDVTATFKGIAVTVSDRLSCYDVYPSPTIDTPAPCPVPEQTGGGRTS